MIELIFTPDDVAGIRFAFSPIGELVNSLRVLADPSRRALHLPWVRTTAARIRGLDLAPLHAVVPPVGYMPDFLTPPPRAPMPDFAAELEIVRATDPARLAAEVAWLDGDQVVSATIRLAHADARQELIANPARAITRLADLLARYWSAALEPYWPRLRDLLETDVLRRSRALAGRGMRGLFADLHELVRWDGDRLLVGSSYGYRAELHGRGLVLTPSAFAWPEILTMIPPNQPALSYPPYGVATLWEAAPAPAPAALAALIGGVRAGVLTALGGPAANGELARRLGVTPGAVSQHLGVLRGCGLVTGHRVGRRVIYVRTEAGDALVAAGTQTR
jgi:DNA-binding transcriptional ArsR family regulator